MTTGPSAEATQAEAVTAVAEAHQNEQGLLMAATLAAILAVWAQADSSNWFKSWFVDGLGQRAYVLLSMAQESVASEAKGYTQAALDVIGAPADIPEIIPSAFAGIASDGRDLENLLASAPIAALQRTRRGAPPAVASEAGKNVLSMIVQTQIADAGRAADQVALATAVAVRRPGRRSRSNKYGYVRMLTLPSCARCIILAGRFYRWNEGFARHVNCDCRHIPAVEALDNDLTTDPKAYFNSLSAQDQADIFGKANAQAIREGADISQVVNATRRGGVFTADDGRRYTREGTTRRGLFGASAGRVLRPTPWQIFKDSQGNQDEVRRQLRRFGYILS